MRRLIIAACLVAGVAQAQVIEYRPTDEDFTTTDYAGNNDGTIVGGVAGSTNAPVSGWKSAAFDGTGRIDVADDASLTPSPDITIEAWIYPTGSGVMEIVSKRNAFNAQNSYSFRLDANRNILWNEGTSSGGSGPVYTFTQTTIPTNQWTHVAISKSGENVALYVNGSLIHTQGGFNNFIFDGTAKLMIGAVNANSPVALWNGNIADVRIWDFARTDFSDKSTQLTGEESGLMAYWRMRELIQKTSQAFTEFTWPADTDATNYVIRIGTDATNLPVVAETTDTNLTFNIATVGQILGESVDMFWRVDVQTATDEIDGDVVQFTADLTDFYIQPVDVQARQAFTMFEWDGDVGAGTNYILRIGTDTTNLPVVAETTDTSLLVDLRTTLPDFAPEAYWRVDVQTESDTIEGAVVQFSYVLATIGDPEAEPVTARADSRVMFYQLWGEGIIYNPVDAVASEVASGAYDPLYTLSNERLSTPLKSGMSFTGFSFARHLAGNVSDALWLGGTDIPSQWIMFDLGEPKNVSGILFYNWNVVEGEINRRIEDISIGYSSDTNAWDNVSHESWELSKQTTLPEPSRDDSYSGDVIRLPENINARYVLFYDMTTPGNRTGISKVRMIIK